MKPLMSKIDLENFLEKEFPKNTYPFVFNEACPHINA